MAVIPMATGPVDVWVRYGASLSDPQGNQTLAFLGFGVVAPSSRIHKEYNPVYSDRGGKAPRDLIYAGEQAFAFVELAEWDELVYRAIASMPRVATGRGRNVFGEIGTLMVTEGFAYQLLLKYPHGWPGNFHPAMVGNGLPAGYRFVAATLIAPEERKSGTQPNSLALSWHCLRTFDKASGTFTLYDHDMTGLPLVPPS